MSTLQQAVDEYLRVRRALGFELERAGRLLPNFAAFVEHHGGTHITAELALRWATAPVDATPQWWADRLSVIRGFAKYLTAIDPRTEVPSHELLPKPAAKRVPPYLYTDQEIGALMDAAQMFPGLKSATYSTLVGLLAATGMRIGEALALERSDLDCSQAVLVVRNTKFGKSRELVLHPSTVAALRAYARQRDRTLPHPRSSSFLLSHAGTRMLYKTVHFYFLRLVERAGLTRESPRRPRLRDLRHSFAIKTLERWYREEADVYARLPALSTYLGHVCPSDTYWYLSATPELLRLAARRLEHAQGSLP